MNRSTSDPQRASLTENAPMIGAYPEMEATGLSDLLPRLREHLKAVAHHERWGRPLIAIAWLHLAFFAVCQGFYMWKDHRPWHHVALWFSEVVAILVLLRVMNGPRWYTKTPLAGVLLRVWSTFLIIAFNMASMNALTGFGIDWFKLSWTALSTFGFATTAWIVHWRFLVPAVQMYFTGLIVSQFPEWGFLIYAVSWFVALHGIAYWIGWRSPAATEAGRVTTDSQVQNATRRRPRGLAKATTS